MRSVKFTGNRYIKYLLVLACLLSSGCATVFNPATGRREMVLIDSQYEASLGREMDARIRKDIKAEDDPAMTARLEHIGRKVAQYSDRTDVQYRFLVVKDKDINAFAVPGGYIYVHSGLMKAATDDELAGVLSHEIGHIAARHGVKRLQAAMGYQVIVNLAIGITGQSGLDRATGLIYNIASLGYSRVDEFQADKLAVRYTRRAGYNPYGLITFFQKLQNEEKKAGGARIAFLSSHPPTKDRIQKALDEIARNPY